ALGGGYRLPAPRDADHAHAQPARRSRDVATDVAEANDAEGGSPQPERIHGRPAPLSLLASEQLDALAHPETPAEGVLGHPRAEDAGGAGHDDARWELRDQKALDAGPHHLDPSERGGAGEKLAGKVPRVEDLGPGDERGGLGGGGGDVNGDGAAGKADQSRVGARRRRLGMVHEDRARGHAPILARSSSSKRKSMVRSGSPADWYQAHVWASPEARV